MVKESGRFNFEGCRIPIPTAIRYDRIEVALGSALIARQKLIRYRDFIYVELINYYRLCQIIDLILMRLDMLLPYY